MPFTYVYNALEEIAAEPSSNKKQLLLRNHLLRSEVFAKTVEFMLSEDMSFNIKDLPEPRINGQKYSAETIFGRLKELSKQRGATADDKQILSDMCLGTETREVVHRILNKDPRAGFGLSLVTKVCPDLIFQTPYQRCSGPDKTDRIQFPAIVQKKADGMFTYTSLGFAKDLFNHPFLTRRGKSFDLFGHLTDEISYLSELVEEHFPDPVFAGELTLIDASGQVVPRKTGNGILNKFIKGTGTEEEAKRVVYSIWDVYSGKDFRDQKSDVAYDIRYRQLNDAMSYLLPDKVTMKNMILSGIRQKVRLIESEIVHTLPMAQAFYQKMRDQGEEGAILKDMSSTWKNGTSTTMVKMKHFAQAEFRITGVVEGKGKYVGMLGALEFASEDVFITGNVGSGFLDNERDLEYWRGHIGGIVTLQFESVISDKKTGKKSLFLPTFVESRFNEKSVADICSYIEGL